ncbi:MAG TPA: hypothetical protein VK619_19950 [Pyrinomonadaceae bacterium]|nr:hypothetical protein [Pyrinomonadaceae bacterium]
MKRLPLVLSLLLISLPIFAQHRHQMPANPRPVVLMTGIGENHHPVSTRNAEAQRFFDQGLLLIYAFNHDEAVRSFKRAAEFDQNLAMAHWGVALALGPNINLDVDPDRERAAYEETQKAMSLLSHASEEERAYIEALAKRYSIEPQADLKKLAVDYKNAMGEVMRRYPDDTDAATLYAESAMDLRPWKLWNPDGSAAEGTDEIIAVLESVLKRNPNHVGANHYYIHAVEASPHPERGLTSAGVLRRNITAAGHLVHMPGHIYMRVGDYAAVADVNEHAATVDRAYLQSTGVQGIYGAGYYSHNLHFLVVAYSMMGDYRDARRAIDQLDANVAPYMRNLPPLEGFFANKPMVLVRFRRWDEILRAPAIYPATTPTSNAMWHWARGMALASTGQIERARVELRLLLGAASHMPADAQWGLNKLSDILEIASNVLNARIASAQRNYQMAVQFLQKAVQTEDALAYDEPPAWYLPSRESLGAVMMLSGQYAEAEKVFREDLIRNPHSGRSLFGLMQSLKAQNKQQEAQAAETEFTNAWKRADTQLKIEEM